MKTKTILAMLMAVFSCLVNAQGTWFQKADCPQKGGSGSGFSIAGKGYLCTGFDGGNYRNDLWEFDPAANSWTKKSNFPGIARGSAVGFAINGKGYVGLGSTGTAYKDFYEYDPVTDTWTKKKDFPGAISYSTASFVIGNKAYISTGNNSSRNSVKETWEYDPATDTWTQKANFGGISRSEAIGFSVGGYGYVGAGWTSSVQIDFWQYDPVADTWTKKANCPSGGYSCAAFSMDSLGYLYTGSGIQNFYGYSPATNKWKQLPLLPDTNRPYTVELVIGNKGYIIAGGSPVGGNYYRDTWEYDPDVTTLIGEVFSDKRLTVYPNPFSIQTTLWVADQLQDATLTIRNCIGQILWQAKNISGDTITLERSDLPSGLYFVQLAEKNKPDEIIKVIITD